MAIKTFSNILYPTDFSELSLHALQYAKMLAKKFSAKIHCLNVVESSYFYLAGDVMESQLPIAAGSPSLTPMGGLLPTAEPKAVITESQKYLDKFVKKHIERDLRVVKAVRYGTAFVEIINYARKKSINLIVMGTHGRGGLQHVLMGSVAEKVIRKSPVPVLTIRSPKHKFKMP